MIKLGIQQSALEPNAVEFTADAVFLATNIHPYEKEIEGRMVSGFEYECTKYDKDEYLMLQNSKILSLEEELQATKILLGVD